MSQQSMPNPILTVLLLTHNEEQAAMEREAFRREGFRQVRLATSGVEGARGLAKQVEQIFSPFTELVVCHPQLGDMSSKEFAQLVRLHPLLAALPMLAIAENSSRKEERCLLEAGFDGILLRPLIPAELRKTMDIAALAAHQKHQILHSIMLQGAEAPKTEDFFYALEEAARKADPVRQAPDVSYRKGLALLKEGKREEAQGLLQRAAQDGDWAGEAHLALAALHRGKGEKEKYLGNLVESLMLFGKTQAWGRARQVCQRLVQDFPNYPNPVLRKVEQLVAQGEIALAVDWALIGHNFYEAQGMVLALHKGCMAHAQPEKTHKLLLKHLQVGGDALAVYSEDITSLFEAAKEQAGTALAATATGPGKIDKKLKKAKKSWLPWKKNKAQTLGLELEDEDIAELPAEEAALGVKLAKAGVGRKAGAKKQNAIELLDEYALPENSETWAVVKATAKLFFKKDE